MVPCTKMEASITTTTFTTTTTTITTTTYSTIIQPSIYLKNK